MLAPRQIPKRYLQWNSAQHAPWGRRGRGRLAKIAPKNPLVAWYVTPYGWQTNNSIRRFEYPWAFETIKGLGEHLVLADIGAGLAGMQFSLARAGHEVHAVDPGVNARGRGWELDPDHHARLARRYRAPVRLHPTSLPNAKLADNSVDVVLSVSTIEHFTAKDLEDFADHARRVLKPDGHYVLTVDLFLDLEPFTSRKANRYGTNVNVYELLGKLNAELTVGTPEELYGFPAFDADAVQSRLDDFLIGAGYPGMAQCLVARPR